MFAICNEYSHRDTYTCRDYERDGHISIKGNIVQLDYCMILLARLGDLNSKYIQ